MNTPSTESQSALRLPSPIRHYHGSKSVPTQEVALHWSPADYAAFINNYTGGMSEWVPDYFLAYNLSPKPSAFSNAPDPRQRVGTEHVLRYLGNAHHAIDQLHDNCLKVDPDENTPFPLYQEIGHQSTSPHLHVYVNPLVPTDPQIFVMHKVNVMIFWVMNIHNQLYDIQSLRTLNTPHQNSRRDNISELKTF